MESEFDSQSENFLPVSDFLLNLGIGGNSYTNPETREEVVVVFNEKSIKSPFNKGEFNPNTPKFNE